MVHLCDTDWPHIYRIQPLLEWSYHDIWDYIRSKSLPYCILYDQGYSSLGSVTNTLQNPHLISEAGFLPPWTLDKVETERLGRG
jgi:FAD synthetase